MILNHKSHQFNILNKQEIHTHASIFPFLQALQLSRIPQGSCLSKHAIFYYNLCINLIWCHVWIVSASEPIRKLSDWWCIISVEPRDKRFKRLPSIRFSLLLIWFYCTCTDHTNMTKDNELQEITQHTSLRVDSMTTLCYDNICFCTFQCHSIKYFTN